MPSVRRLKLQLIPIISACDIVEKLSSNMLSYIYIIYRQ